jgi:hypothetical protein
MKNLYAIHLLFLFIGFLSTPTLVKLLDKKADIIIVYNLNEEEKSENSNSLNIEFVLDSHFLLDLKGLNKSNSIFVDFYQFSIKSHDLSTPSPPPDLA